MNNLTLASSRLRDGGGATNFPRAESGPRAGDKEGGTPEVSDHGGEDECSGRPSTGLSFYPQAGSALLFYSLHANGEPDERSLHAGCDVRAAEAKFAANFWMWNQHIREVTPHAVELSRQLIAQWL
uniref:Prolyl 4-hydroxylase alpha subunit Fe(2+) 2OG dioxygenase domain-containing protein n=1 Tax=Haptolina brevifila TaxID=156173 RepID=A0A7S2I5S3_9EUKA